MSLVITDSQIHLWRANTTERPWPAHHHAAPHFPEPLGPDDFIRDMDAAGVARAIIVPPSWEGNYNDLIIDAARRHPARYAGMGRLDIEEPGAERHIPRWREQPGMLGIRLTFRREADQQLLLKGRGEWLWATAERAGVPLTMHPVGYLDAVDGLAERHPGLRVSIDHCALRRTKGPAAFEDLPQLLALAKRPNVAVKLSTMPFYSAESYPHRDIESYIKRIYDGFGPKRMFWGSDWTRLGGAYQPIVTHFTDEMPWLSDEDKIWIMGRGIAEWLDWPVDPALEQRRSA